MLLGLVFVLASCTGPEPDPDREDWIRLFDGRSLAGWTPKVVGSPLGDNPGDVFRVQDGQLVLAPPPGDERPLHEDVVGLLIHERTDSFYRLRVEYRFLGGEPGHVADRSWRRAGLLVHALEVSGMGADQLYPPSAEIELLGGNGQDDRPTANLCPRGLDVMMAGEKVTRTCVSSASETHHGDEWVRVDVDVLGAERVDHVVDSVRVLSWSRPEYDGRIVTEGRIALKAGRHPVAFRRVDLLPLRGCTDPAATNHKTYYLSSDNSQCQYEHRM